MPYCKKCGKEIDPNDPYCRNCGAPTMASGTVYRRAEGGGGMTTVRVIAVIFGGLIALSGFGLLSGGLVLTSSQGMLTDSSGYINTRQVNLESPSYAIVQQNVNVNIDPGMMWRMNNNDIVSLRITAKAFDPNEQIFIGIAPAQDAYAYLNTVYYDRLVNTNWGWERSTGSQMQPTYQTHPGNPLPTPPSTTNIWTTQAKGLGSQTLEWSPRSGDYWIVLMNADGSPAVDADVQIGAKITILSGIGIILSWCGLVTLLVGVLIIYFGGFRR